MGVRGFRRKRILETKARESSYFRATFSWSNTASSPANLPKVAPLFFLVGREQLNGLLKKGGPRVTGKKDRGRRRLAKVAKNFFLRYWPQSLRAKRPVTSPLCSSRREREKKRTAPKKTILGLREKPQIVFTSAAGDRVQRLGLGGQSA